MPRVEAVEAIRYFITPPERFQAVVSLLRSNGFKDVRTSVVDEEKLDGRVKRDAVTIFATPDEFNTRMRILGEASEMSKGKILIIGRTGIITDD